MMKTAFVFSGQGAQKVGMGRELYETSPAAKSIFDRADAALGRSLSQLCFEGPEEALTETANCQPAIYTMSLACLAAYLERNPEEKPVAAAGLSLGEYAAFAAAGAFSFEDGLLLVSKRAALMEKACQENPGGMAAVIGSTPEVVEEVCALCDLDVANFNCPGQIVISGPVDRVNRACDELKNRGVRRAVPLKVSGSFHSRLMNSAAAGLRPALDATPMQTPAFPVIHNFTAKPAGEPDSIRENLMRQVNGSVRWETSVLLMAEQLGAERFIEFGPGNVVTGLIHKIIPGASLQNCSDASGLSAN